MGPLWPPSIAGYALVLVAPLAVGLLLYRLLLAYYLAKSMGDFISAAREFLSYRHRGVLLIPAFLAGPIGFALGLLIAPDQVGTNCFAKVYGVFLQTVAGAIVALLVVIAVQNRLASRQTRFATREAGIFAVLWILVGEIAALAALSPGLPHGLQKWAFAVMIGGASAGIVAILFIAGWLLESQDDQG